MGNFEGFSDYISEARLRACCVNSCVCEVFVNGCVDMSEVWILVCLKSCVVGVSV